MWFLLDEILNQKNEIWNASIENGHFSLYLYLYFAAECCVNDLSEPADV